MQPHGSAHEHPSTRAWLAAHRLSPLSIYSTAPQMGRLDGDSWEERDGVHGLTGTVLCGRSLC